MWRNNSPTHKIPNRFDSYGNDYISLPKICQTAICDYTLTETNVTFLFHEITAPPSCLSYQFTIVKNKHNVLMNLFGE